MSLQAKFLKLTQETNSITLNPLLNCFEQDELTVIDIEAKNDEFIKEKKKNILKIIKDIKIDFNPKLKSAFNEYSEAMIYLRLKKKIEKVIRTPEEDSKTPDFKIEFSDNSYINKKSYTVYAELKSLSFANGDINYKDAMDKGLNANIEIEEQINSGRKIAFGITEIDPLYKNKNYNPISTKYAIETLIQKISQNLKEGQFSKGETVLLVNLKQLILPSNFIESGLPVFQEKSTYSIVSGILWNIAFGKVGHLIYKPIQFEGKENIDGELEQNGILINYKYIKAIVFLDYKLGDTEPKIVGLHLDKRCSDSILTFLYKFCDFVNDDMNSNGWKLRESEL